MAFEPHRERAQAAQPEINVVGTDAQSVVADEVLQLRVRRAVGGDGAEHDVGMAADIFGAGLDRQVDAVIERAVIDRGRPGVVHQDQRALVVGRRGDGGNVLHLERQRARRFEIDGARVRLHQVRDRAADQRIVIAHGDAVAGQGLIAELSGRAVGAVGDEQMVARAHHRQQRRRDRRQTGRQQRDAGALRSFEREHGRLQRFGRRRAAPPVLIARAVGEIILGVGIKHGRGVIDRRIDEAMIGAGLAPGRDHAGVLVARRGVVVLLAVHSVAS